MSLERVRLNRGFCGGAHPGWPAAQRSRLKQRSVLAPISRKPVLSKAQPGVSDLLGRLRDLIVQARQQALRAVDLVQVRTSWEVGRNIVEFEQGGRTRAVCGAGLLPQSGERLTAEFGKGFDAANLYKMTQFYWLFPNLDALRLNLSWTPESAGHKPPRSRHCNLN